MKKKEIIYHDEDEKRDFFRMATMIFTCEISIVEYKNIFSKTRIHEICDMVVLAMNSYSHYKITINNCRCFVNIFLNLFFGTSIDYIGIMFGIWFGGKLTKTKITVNYAYNFLIKNPIYFYFIDNRYFFNYFNTGTYKLENDDELKFVDESKSKCLKNNLGYNFKNYSNEEKNIIIKSIIEDGIFN